MAGAAVAGAAAALLFQAALRQERAEAQRWRERAYEAEARIAAQRGASAEAPRAAAAVVESPPVVAPSMTGGRDAPVDASDTATAPPLSDPAWEAVVSGHLEAEVLRRYGRSLTPEQESRLRDRLRDVRDAGDRLEQDASDDALAGARQRLTRSIVMLEADRAFREEIGVGLTEFVRGLDPDQVEEVGADDLAEVSEAEPAADPLVPTDPP